MKNNKLILLLTLFVGQLLCMDQLTELGKRKSPDMRVQENMQANAMNQVLGNKYLLQRILDMSGLDIEIALVSKLWNSIVKKESKERYMRLMYQVNPIIMRSLLLPAGTMPRYKGFQSFIKLYEKLTKLAGKPMTKPEVDITSPQVLLELAREAQQVQDENLAKVWSKMRQAIVAATPAVEAAMPAKNSALEQIRDWLRNEENQAAIQQVTELDLNWFGLTCLPEEISLFIGLRALWLLNNQLREVSIPKTLTALERLSVSCNQLEEVTIFDTLTALQAIYLYDNQLEEVTIPNTLTALRDIWLRDNRLTLKSIRIPDVIRRNAYIVGEARQRPAADS